MNVYDNRMSRTSRRQFAKSLAAAGAVVPLAALLAEQPEKKRSAFGDALAELVRAQYGHHLSSEELQKIDGDFQEWAPVVERFREHPLTNADEPDFTFAALVERW